MSSKISFGTKKHKQFLGYFYKDHKVKPLHIMLPKRSSYLKFYDGETKWMYFFIEGNDVLKKI